ncbi:MAG: hydantoinase/oxoprolinase family protein, partial [Alphaproteobacteria bacterium]|nr:hydantoinase/oxoprolinase family protein [Alphaproteobacteria bacterium]
ACRDGRDVTAMLHATTVATNAVLERKGAATGLITTEGFRDVLIIGRQKRYETYDLYIDKPKPLVQRRHIAEVRERLAADGSVVTPLDMASVDRAIDAMIEAERDTVAISLLHAYANGDHECAIRARFQERAPDIAVSISSEVSPKFREYERTSTVVTNAYVMAMVDRYLARLESALAHLGSRRNLQIMQSNGGLVSPEIARDFPVRIIESGPAAGILMCAEVGRAIGHDHIVTFDMGGTTAKLGAIDDGTPAIMPTFEIDLVRSRRGSGLPLNVPAIEMLEIGAGGGSIARVEKGMIVVGPDSAGAEPGPICYGKGGDKPTITDANLVLGYLSPARFNAGTMRLDLEAAGAGIDREIARPLGISPLEAAWGVHLIATTNMENALRLVSVERGRDPRRYAMVAFGGAGPLHAARLARRVGVPQVIVPNGAGVGSAIGLLQATPRIDVTATRVLRLDQAGAVEAIASLYEDLERQALAELRRLDEEATPAWSRYAQMRYAGQGFEIHVDLPPGPIDVDYRAKLIEAFRTAYLRKNKFLDDDGVVEGVDWTLVATQPRKEGGAVGTAGNAAEAGSGGTTRPAWFPEAGGLIDTRVLERMDFEAGAKIAGPCIINDPHCTIVVPPGDTVGMSSEGHIVIDIAKGAST